MKENILIVEDEFIVADRLQTTLEDEGYVVCGVATNYEEALELVDKEKPTWVLLDIHLDGVLTGIDLASKLSEKDIPFIYLSATTSQEALEAIKYTKPYGFMAKPFKDRDLMMMLDIARYRHEHMAEARQRMEKGALEKFNEMQTGKENRQDSLVQFAQALQTVINFDLLCISGDQSERLVKKDIYIERLSLKDYSVMSMDEILTQLRISERDYKSLRKFYSLNNGISSVNDIAFKRHRMDWPLLKNLSNQYKLESAAFFPVEMGNCRITLTFFSKRQQGYVEGEAGVLQNLQQVIRQSLLKIFENDDDGILPDRNSKVVCVSNTKNCDSGVFAGIIGKSPQLLSVLDKLKIVAPGETSVLITGESGTGKERIAEVLHELSPRKAGPFIIVNCAALPLNLVESELFGHEKGAFTGASDRRIGKFEQANDGTIFLDEIGELPMESQVKLLRVLQSREIERLGGNQRKKINVRIVAATNRNMEKEVAEGRFRLDLYYRLNVFPLELPPLRARMGDIAELVDYYAEKFAIQNNRKTPMLAPAVMNQLMHYSWPGNIRELAHIMERSVLLTPGSTIEHIILPKVLTQLPDVEPSEDYVKSFDENERDHILSVLKRCNWRIAGDGGAAELLKVPPTTLNSKIKRLGISRQHVAGSN